MSDDLIKRSDALAACGIGPCDEWSDFTKSGYNLAADDCKRNIAALTSNHTVDVGEMVDRIEQLERERKQNGEDYCALMEKHDALHNKLAKAMEALRLADKVNLMPPIVAKTIHAVLAELEGKE